jgi:uncharacterized protein
VIDRACISLNHRCNLRCKYCHFAGKEAAIDDENYEFQADEVGLIVTNIVEYCNKNGIAKFKFGIVGSGEPLLSFDTLSHIVDRVCSIGGELFRLYTITNGICLTDEQLRFFYQSSDIIELNFSLDGNEKIHDAMRQGYVQTIAAIERYEVTFGEKPRINATVTRKSIENTEELIAYFTNNGFMKINFSIVSDVSDTAIKITQEEYEEFIGKCATSGIAMRQKRDNIQRTHDCAKFGRLCGVGHSNIFYTRNGIYPCGRFFGLEEYRLADFGTKLDEVEKAFHKLKGIADGACYYDVFVGGSI